MKLITYPTLLVTAALALMQPFSAFAADDNPKDKKLEKKPGPASAVKGPAPAVSKPVYHAPPVHAPTKPDVQNKTVNKNVNTNKTVNTTNYHKTVVAKNGGTNPPPAGSKTVKNTTIVKATPHARQSKSWAGPAAGGGQYTAANNYGGRWVAGNSHPGWNRVQVNVWNGHHYRWFNGGWLMIDGGFWPTGYYQYQIGGSKMANAQAELANMGYYNGPIDGVPSPDTRQAIADYQSDYNLPVTGHLNPPTQVSLGLQ